MDHRPEQDERTARLTLLACPRCGLAIFTLQLAVPTMAWCSQCPDTPRLERTAS
jgi:hypothetical protein